MTTFLITSAGWFLIYAASMSRIRDREYTRGLKRGATLGYLTGIDDAAKALGAGVAYSENALMTVDAPKGEQ